jgi:hypothetical protein
VFAAVGYYFFFRTPQLEIVNVKASLGTSLVGDNTLEVRVDLQTKSSMPHVAPYVDVKAICLGASDEGKAFFMKLSGRGSGESLSDSITLFRVRPLQADAECELLLGASKGSPAQVQYCFKEGETRAGPCDP